MERALIVTAGEKPAKLLLELLRTLLPEIAAATAVSGAKARRMLLEADYDLLLISAPLGDEHGDELAAKAAEGDVGVILLEKAEYADEVAAKLEPWGVFVLEKPIHKPFFFRAVRFVEASNRRIKGLERERESLRDKLEELKYIDRAKCALIRYLDLTEPQAHRYIEKQAMDLRRSKGEVAQSILRTYEG